MAITAIASALGAFKSAKDIAEAMIRGGNAAAFQGKMIEFQSKIIDANSAAFAAQDERSALLERISELEKQVADLEAWETEKNRYELKEVREGAFAYALKDKAKTTEPAHYICASCYQAGNKSILQQTTLFPGRCDVLICPQCNSAVYRSGAWQSEHGAGTRRERRNARA